MILKFLLFVGVVLILPLPDNLDHLRRLLRGYQNLGQQPGQTSQLPGQVTRAVARDQGGAHLSENDENI